MMQLPYSRVCTISHNKGAMQYVKCTHDTLAIPVMSWRLLCLSARGWRAEQVG